ncbi:MAG: gliding motility protein GldB [Tannerellaceae bacterium]|jgi:hypothetical protein|nr:gliding motility protein GldB [Tannerellaceae bacterium]
MTTAVRLRSLCILALLLSCLNCKGQSREEVAAPIRIYRFDKELFRLVESENDAAIQGELLCDYPEMLEVLGKGVFNMQTTETPGFFTRIVNYYSEPTLRSLYRDALAVYDSIPGIEQELGEAFARLRTLLPLLNMPPRVYMHVSGFGQNILAAEKALSVSIDRYMGRDYPLYARFFNPQQAERMQPALIVPDYLAGWLMSEYPFAGREDVPLDRMIYEGKIKYLVAQAMPELPQHTLMGWSAESLGWYINNEAKLWKIVANGMNMPNPYVMQSFFDESPATFLSADAPAGAPGLWFGLRIVELYMKETNASPEALMATNNAQEILSKSKYKPL